MDTQFYPTPASLTSKMWGKFDDGHFHHEESFILEPSAGVGSLLDPKRNSGYQKLQADVIEIDFERQAVLREKGYTVVGHDFLQFECRKIYTHIIMNPPFKYGAEHVLKAWDILIDGELVALVNAETLLNQCDRHREQLVKIIADNAGTVEFVTGAFSEPDTRRTTDVEVAIIHLKKSSDFKLEFIEGLRPDIREKTEVEVAKHQDLALPVSTVKQAVTIFNAAVKALWNEVTIGSQLAADSQYYRGLLSDSIIKTDEEKKKERSDEERRVSVTKTYNDRYQGLKEQAWSHILEATDVGKNLSSEVYKSLQAEFKNISQLEFTAVNINGFLLGLIQQRGNMNLKMLLEVFDRITRYHSENRVYYKGWKSNDKHKTNAFRIKMTRFILPRFNYSSYSGIDWEKRRELQDFDMAFAVLDGKQPGQCFGVCDAMSKRETLDQLVAGGRVGTTYFDIRYFPGAGTVHFFPRNKKLIDRLNRMVGRERKWLPGEDEAVDPAFWLQFEKAENIQEILDKDPEFKKATNWIREAETTDISKSLDRALTQLKIDPKAVHRSITQTA